MRITLLVILFGLSHSILVAQSSNDTVAISPSINPVVLAPGQSFQLTLEKRNQDEKCYVVVNAPEFRPIGIIELTASQQIMLTSGATTKPGLYLVILTIFGRANSKPKIIVPVTIGPPAALESLRSRAPRILVADQIAAPSVSTAPASSSIAPSSGTHSVPVTLPSALQGPTNHRVSGSLTWSGQADKDGLIRIENQQASTGTLRGDFLPGVPVKITVTPSDVVVSQSPLTSNGFQRLVLRMPARKRIGSITIQWEVIQ